MNADTPTHMHPPAHTQANTHTPHTHTHSFYYHTVQESHHTAHTHTVTPTHPHTHTQCKSHTTLFTHSHTHTQHQLPHSARVTPHCTHAHTHTCTCTCTCTCIYHCQNWLRGPIQGVSQQEVTGLVVPLAAGTPALSPHLHGPLSALGYSSMGLQDP